MIPNLNSGKDDGWYSVVLVDSGKSKIAVVKEIKANSSMLLREVKNLADNTPSIIASELNVGDAKKLVMRMTDCGATTKVIHNDTIIDSSEKGIKDKVIEICQSKFNEKLSKFSSSFWKQARAILEPAGYYIK